MQKTGWSINYEQQKTIRNSKSAQLNCLRNLTYVIRYSCDIKWFFIAWNCIIKFWYSHPELKIEKYTGCGSAHQYEIRKLWAWQYHEWNLVRRQSFYKTPKIVGLFDANKRINEKTDKNSGKRFESQKEIAPSVDSQKEKALSLWLGIFN